MQAFPYGKLHCSQWNVDQAAGLIFCSVATARSLGIPRERWVFPLATADANHMIPFTERRALHRCAGFAKAAVARLRARAARRSPTSRTASSTRASRSPCGSRCASSASRDDRPLTVTGGMAFAGGPLNHFVFQALVRMAQVLRDDPGSLGLVTAVSGILTKQGVESVVERAGRERRSPTTTSPRRPSARPNASSSSTARRATATIASYTVLYESGAPKRAVLLCDLDDGRRTLVLCDDRQLVALATREELCGRALRIGAGGAVALA